MTETLRIKPKPFLSAEQKDRLSSLPFMAEWLIPVAFLWGTQLPSEFNEKSARTLKKNLRSDGLTYLQHNPISVYLHFDKVITAYILDGHHRARYAPQESIFSIPTKIYSLATLASLFRQDPDQTIQELLNHSLQAVNEFGYLMQGKNKPQHIEAGLLNAEELIKHSNEPDFLIKKIRQFCSQRAKV